MRALIEEKLNGIEIPKELHESCAMGVKRAKEEMEENTMKMTKTKKGNTINRMGRLAATAAVLAICFCVLNNTSMATGVKGFFKDVTRFDGAVVGTEYVQATEEIDVCIVTAAREQEKLLLSMEITFLNEAELPFRDIEELNLGKVQIVDKAGEKMVEITEEHIKSAIGTVSNGKAVINILVTEGEFHSGEEYTLVINSVYGSKKADAPLEMKGNWECAFQVK